MKPVAAVLVVFFLFFCAAVVDAAEFEISKGVSQMIWKEYLSSQKPYMEEDGLAHSLDIIMSSKLSKNTSSQLGLEFFFGNNISYKGQYIQDGSPHNTTGIWLGIALEEKIGYKINIQRDFSISPFFSVAISDWQRQVSAENWFAVIAKLGLRAEKGIFFAEVGLSRPLYTEVSGSWKNVSWVNGGRKTSINVNPKGEISPFGEIGITIKKRITLKLSYKELRWEKSEEEHIGPGINVFQPKTNQKFFGLSAGVLF